MKYVRDTKEVHTKEMQVTVDLDVVVRSDLINFLIAESKERNATILCEWMVH